MRQSSKQKAKVKSGRHTLRLPEDVSEKALKMAGEDLDSLNKFMTKLVIRTWNERHAAKAA